MSSLSAGWISLAKVPFAFFSKPCNINHNEFVIAPSSNSSSGIYKYNKTLNEWETIINYIGGNHYIHGATINKTKKLFYVYDTAEYEILVYNLKENKLQNRIKNITFGSYPRLFCHKDEINIIGSAVQHAIVNQETHSLTTIFDHFDFNFNQQTSPICLEKHGIIYVKSQDRYLLFGGCDNCFLCFDTIFEFTVNSTQQKWKKLDVKIPEAVAAFGIVITCDDRFVIILGGHTDHQRQVDDIYVFDTKSDTFYKSKLKCPLKRRYHAVITGDLSRDNLLCYGYIRQCYKMNQFKEMLLPLPPSEIIQLIIKWVFNEDIHLIAWLKGDHWKISAHEILIPC